MVLPDGTKQIDIIGLSILCCLYNGRFFQKATFTLGIHGNSKCAAFAKLGFYVARILRP